MARGRSREIRRGEAQSRVVGVARYYKYRVLATLSKQMEKHVLTIATLTSKGRTTIPKDIRRKLGLKPGDKLHFNLMPDGTISVRAKAGTLKDLAGILHRAGTRTVTVEEMNDAVARAAVARFRRGARK